MVNKDDFLKNNRVEGFSKQLEDKLKEVLAAISNNYLDLLVKKDLIVVLTGGGATLPMVKKLADGVVETKRGKIQRKPAALVPPWITDTYPQFEPQYPQLAVAIGGAERTLPKQRDTSSPIKQKGFR